MSLPTVRTLVLGGIRSGKSQWAEIDIADEASVRRAAEILVAATRRLPHGVQASVDTNPMNML